ncbi:MAG: hypothetical protein KJ970_00960 [Candidatus Eisenbacteria bacterium]|uniref:T9SS type A sorting domain-containing protein n=1 Tax=Eiseniibacteriota bacterium TaxID=2212470 RepID=A0A948W5D2_UNCEI|nr:hypothetical protein [Candidatus Eisenbacteria bacterium]MBU1949034.1 hypothetical protein [Candidatus Eisenbacteria bacterium]MBU2689471.1 hypothetical protein [Candidatus Eisenbacteria bacterium]
MRKGLLCCFLLVLIGSVPAWAQVAKFMEPPEVSDQRVSWKWAAIDSDPIYTGNSTLKRVRPISEHPFHDRTIAKVLLDQSGLFGFSLSEDGQQVYKWELDSGLLVEEYVPIPAPAVVLNAALHRDGLSLAAVLDDGRIAIWDLQRPDTLWSFPVSPGPCYDILYLPGSLNHRFLTAGSDGKVRKWDIELEPGMSPPEPAQTVITFAAAEARSLAINTTGRFLAAGSSRGEIRKYNLVENYITSIFQARPSSIEKIIIGFTGRSMVTIDELHGVAIWNFNNDNAGQVPLVEIPPGNHGDVRMALTPPDDLLLILSYDDGLLQVRSGATGQVFQVGQEPYPTSSFISHPDGSRAILGRLDGDLVLWSAGFCRPSPGDIRCFGGYKIWRGLRPERVSNDGEADGDEMELLRTYSYGDSSWTFAGIDTLRYFIDPDSISDRGMGFEGMLPGPVNGFPYYYAITQFDRVFEDGSVFDVNVCEPQDSCVIRGIYRDPETGEMISIIPRRSPRTEKPILGKVWVIPNPYEKNRVDWDDYTFPHVRFVNLPSEAEIRIYTLAGDLVRIIQHGRDSLNQLSGEENWDLKNGDGENVVSGVYFYTVRTPEGKVSRGFLTLIL